MANLLPVAVAQKYILSDFSSLGSEFVDLHVAHGRILSNDFYASIDLPSFDNSAMDGFILRAEDSKESGDNGEISFLVTGDIKAGIDPTITIGKGQAARIVTGAMIPSGGDTVIPVENTNIKEWEPGSYPPGEVIIGQPVEPGKNIRVRGNYIQKGDLLLRKGIRLTPQSIGMIASQGVDQIEVNRRPRIGLFSTGDELLKIGEPYVFGKVYDSNSLMLEALVEKFGCKCIRLGSISDDIISIKTVMDFLVESDVDLILTSAGVSMGAHDYVRYVIEQNGRLKFWRVNMRPGKPLVYGSYKDYPFIGLPGNPVSAFIGFIVFVKPVLDKLMGSKYKDIFRLSVTLLDCVKSDRRESYVRANISFKDGDWRGSVMDDQGSGNLISLVQANALLRIPQNVGNLPINSVVKGCLIDDLMLAEN